MSKETNMLPTFLDTKLKSHCTGCKVCASICPADAITFTYDEEGFWYPQIDGSKCINCNKCRRACPHSEPEREIIKDENQTYAAYLNSESVLKESVSGGMFTAFSDVVLNKNGYVFGCVYDDDCKAIVTMAENSSERNRMRGAKYVQSDMGKIYKKIEECVKTNKPVLVTGLPCQIDAVNRYFSKHAENLFTCELVCHGSPSPGIFAEYVALKEKEAGKKIKEVVFRDKAEGWTMPLRRFRYADGSDAAELLNADAFNNLFLGTNCILRPSCYECRYAGKRRCADLSIADFWGIQKNHPEMFNENKGCSLVLVNTEKGKDLFENTKRGGGVKFKQVPLCDAQEHNTPLVRPSPLFWERDSFFRNKKTKGLDWCLHFYMSRKFFDRVKRKIRYVIWKSKNGSKK